MEGAKRVILLDVNGPLGEYVKIWLEVARRKLGESHEAVKEVADLVRELRGVDRSLLSSPTAHVQLSQKTKRLMELVARLHPLVEREFTEEVRKEAKKVIPHVRKLLRSADIVFLYSDMPQPVTRTVARTIKEELGEEGSRLHAIGSPVPPVPVPISVLKPSLESGWTDMESGVSLWREVRRHVGDVPLKVIYITDDKDKYGHVDEAMLKRYNVVEWRYLGNVYRDGAGKGIPLSAVSEDPWSVKPHRVVRLDRG